MALGYLAHYGLLLSLGGLLRVSLPQPSVIPALTGVAAGLVLLVGFAPPLLALTRVAPLRVLRRDIGLPPISAWVAYALGLGAFVALLMVAARDLKLGLTTAGGFVGAGVAFAVLALGCCWRSRAACAAGRAAVWGGASRWPCSNAGAA